MQVSAEIRWFWSTACPERIDRWFGSGTVPPGGGNTREDEYLHEPDQTELGLKSRGRESGIEAKGLVAVLLQPSDAMPFVGPIQIWCKWQSLTLTLRDLPTVRTRKTRWLRKFDTSREEPIEIPLGDDGVPKEGGPLPRHGCNVELTRIELDAEQIWWTLGFEAFGDVFSVERNLRSTLSVMASRHPPALGSGELLSYPAWLSMHVPRQE
jgi:hypothetical protein